MSSLDQNCECLIAKPISKRKNTSHSCPFCRAEPETFKHLFKCTDGFHCPQSLKDVTLQNLANTNDIDNLKQSIEMCMKEVEFFAVDSEHRVFKHLVKIFSYLIFLYVNSFYYICILPSTDIGVQHFCKCFENSNE